MNQETLRKISAWALSDDTGSSSKFLARCALGIDEVRDFVYVPRDPDDFGRCYRLAKLLNPTELTNALVRAEWHTGGWKILRKHWSELSELFHDCFVQQNGDRTRFYKRWKELGL